MIRSKTTIVEYKKQIHNNLPKFLQDENGLPIKCLALFRVVGVGRRWVGY